MPISHKARYPLESFDPRLRDIWLTAIRQPVEIQLETSKQAIAFQNRLQQYRAALKRERPEDARMLYRAKCTRRGNLLLVTLQDSEFSSVLDQIGGQLLTGSRVPETPVGSDATPSVYPEPGASPPADTPLEFSELFADIPISHITEEES